MHPSIYFECEGSRVGQTDVALFRQYMVQVHSSTVAERENRMLHCFHALLLARLLLLERFRSHIGDDAWDDAIHCKQWLIAQLNGVTRIGTTLFAHLCSVSVGAVLTQFSEVLTRLKARGMRVHFLFDEAHMWHDNKFGVYTTSANTSVVHSQRRTLFTKAVSLANRMSVPSLWVGTALSIGQLVDSQSAFAIGGRGPSAHIVAGFSSLSTANVEAVLSHFLNISDAAVSAMAADLVGRGRLSSEFIAGCYRKGLDSEKGVLAEFHRYRSLMLDAAAIGPPFTATAKSFATVWSTLLQSKAWRDDGMLPCSRFPVVLTRAIIAVSSWLRA